MLFAENRSRRTDLGHPRRVLMTVLSFSSLYTGLCDDVTATANGDECACGDDDDEAHDNVATCSVFASVHALGAAEAQDD